MTPADEGFAAAKIENQEWLKEAADKFKENFVQVIVESRATGYLAAGVLNLNDGRLTVFDSSEFDTYTTDYTRSEALECFTIHDYNDWSV